MGVLLAYLSYGHFLVSLTSAKTAPKDITFLIFTNCSPFFPLLFHTALFLQESLGSWKRERNLLLTIDTIDARNIIIAFRYLGRTDRRGQKGKMLNPQIAILTVRNQFHFHYVAFPIMHLLYPSPPPPPPPPKKKKNKYTLLFHSFGTTVIPRRNRKQFLCKIWTGVV